MNVFVEAHGLLLGPTLVLEFVLLGHQQFFVGAVGFGVEFVDEVI